MHKQQLDFTSAEMEMPIFASVHNLDKRIFVLFDKVTKRFIATLVVGNSPLEVLNGVLGVVSGIVWTACLVLCVFK